MKHLKWWIILLLLVGCLLSGCHTVNGIGKDLQKWTESSVDKPQE